MKSLHDNHYYALRAISELPAKMVVAHEHENLAEFILHELCDMSCMGMRKAALFVDNPDFNCLKGVAGMAHHERFAEGNAWEQREPFSEHMRNAQFNQMIRSVARPSIARSHEAWHSHMKEMANLVAFERAEAYAFAFRHGNKGILIFELLEDKKAEGFEDILALSTALLALCPVF